MLRRLADLGFIAGEPVQVLRRGPGGRDPLAVRVGDTLFALRRAEARCIEVEPAEPCLHAAADDAALPTGTSRWSATPTAARPRCSTC